MLYILPIPGFLFLFDFVLGTNSPIFKGTRTMTPTLSMTSANVVDSIDSDDLIFLGIPLSNGLRGV